MASPTKRTLTIEEVAVRLGVSKRTVYYWIANGRLRTEPPGSASSSGGVRIVAASVPSPRRDVTRGK